MAERKNSDSKPAANRSGVPKSQETEPVVSPAVEQAGVTPTEPGEIVVPESVPGVDTGTPAENASEPLRGIVADVDERRPQDDTPDVHADPPPGEGLTPEDELREEHIRRKQSAANAGTVEELLVGKAESAQEAVDNLRAEGLARVARRLGVTEEEAAKVRLHAVDLDAPPILGHKLPSHDEHRLASDDERSGVDKVRAAVLEGKYPVSVTQAEFEAALQSEGFSDDNRMEARQMARRNEIYLRGR